MKRLAIAAAVVFVVCSPAAAQQREPNPEREKRIERELALVAPEAVVLFQNATRAIYVGDHATAVRLLREAHAKAPAFTPILRRLGYSLMEIGAAEEGRQLLEQAVAQERSPENLVVLGSRLAYPGAGKHGSQADVERAFELAREASSRYEGGDDASYLGLVAQLALSLNRQSEYRQAVQALVRSYPDEMATHYFSAILAALDEDWSVAVAEMRHAERLGLPHDTVEEFLSSGVRTRANLWRVAHWTEYALLAWGAGLFILFVAGKALSRATLTSIERTNPNELISPSERSRRNLYRRLVGAAGYYYYVSLPFVALIVIGGTAAVIYGFLALGRIPIKLALILGFGAMVTVYKMVQSLLLRVESPDPGRALAETEAPRLWDLAREVAQRVGTRPVDEIRVTPGTDLAVYERGSVRERGRDEGRRVLILGVGLLADFRQSAFRAVLAHEYGHFSHRDTAGGDVALRVRQDMMKFAVAMAQQGQAVWWNAAFQFLRCYDFLFRRISHGATRLQEILADRVAAQNYGAAHFEEGLRHVIRRGIEFQMAAGREIGSALETSRACRNLYELQPSPEDRVEDRFAEVLARQTTEDDTHPAPLDRFRFVSGIASKLDPADCGMLWELFVSPESLTNEMTATIEARVRGTAAAG